MATGRMEPGTDVLDFDCSLTHAGRVGLLRRVRFVVLDRPKPCSLAEAQHSLDRLIAAGFDAEIVEHDDNGLNMWANTTVGGEVTPDERYVLQVPRRQARAANLV